MKGQEIFERALDLCALRGETGNEPNDVGDLKTRAVGILNVLFGEMHSLEERLTGRIRPYFRLHSLEESVDLCEDICASVLPYRLAALLIAEEDSELYSVLIDHAKAAANALLAGGKTYRHGIVEVYG